MAAARPRTRLAPEQRRELLVDAAARVFRGRDPASVTFEEIADEAGVSRSLVYNYFADRQGLLEAVSRRSASQLSERITDALATTRGLREALGSAIRVSLEFAHEDPAGYRYASGVSAPPVLPNLVDDRLKQFSRIFGDDADALLVARGVLTSLQAMVLHCVERGPHDIERATEVISAFLAGGFAGVDAIGFRLRPTWPVPA
jgi:AcrR family transcriptional regulator